MGVIIVPVQILTHAHTRILLNVPIF